ncbi:MAG: phosphotransferase family protein [Paracoccaceae bacterium]
MRLPLPIDRLDALLAAEIPGFVGPLTATQFSGGQSNPTYRLDTPSCSFVLRRKPPGDLLPRAHMIEREVQVMRALAPTGFPVPAVRLLCEDPGVIGSAFYVMDHVDGRVAYDLRLPGWTPPARRALAEALTDRLADLHLIDYRAIGLADFGREGGYISRQIGTWTRAYRASETVPIPELDRLIDWLPEAVARLPDETALVHGDWRLDNAILARDGSTIRAILDWELSTLGHPLADLGYWLMTWRFPEGLRWGLATADLAALGLPTLEALAARYAVRTGREAVPDLDLLIAYNAFRMAAICQGVHARALQGNAADPRGARLGADVAPLARVAWDHALRAGAREERLCR